ncbi:MAG: DUF72 domain-containing protein [Thermofilum sp.]
MSLEEFLGLGRREARIRIGTSGWDYEDWVGPLYESEKGMLSSYMKLFDTVEVNSSFYTLLSEKFYEGLARSAPPGFLFSVKMYRGITHRKLLNPKLAEAEIDVFFKSVRPLAAQGKLGAVLVQLPPRGREEIPWFEEFLAAMPEGVRVAVEFRDPSWLSGEVFALLRRYEVGYVVVDEPLLPPAVEVTAGFSYVRWHGRGERPWYYYHYSLEELEPWAERLKQLAEQVSVVLGYFNNHFRGFAPHNALQMLSLLGLAGRRQLEALARMDRYFAAAPPISWGAVKELESGRVEEVLRALAGERRFQRGLEISSSEVQYSLTENGVSARVKSYQVEVDRAGRRLYHDCEDWKKLLESKRFCKHLVKLFLSLPREVSKEILADIVSNLEEWDFAS